MEVINTIAIILEKFWPYLVAVATGLFGAFKWWHSSRCKNDLPLTDEEKRNLPDGVTHELTNLKSSAQKAVRDISIVYNHLNKILANTEATRVLILRMHNCGGVPNINSKLYSSVVHELAKGSRVPVGDVWQAQPLDEGYIKALVDLFVNKQLTVDTATLKSSLLKDAYETLEVKFSMVYEVASSDYEYYYMTIAFDKGQHEMTAEERHELRVRVNLIQKAYTSFLERLR